MPCKKSIFTFIFSIQILSLFAQAPFEAMKALGDRAINALAVDAQNAKWIGTESGLLCVQGDTFRLVSGQNAVPMVSISCLLIDKEQTKWVGTYSSQVFRIDAQEKATVRDFQEWGNWLVTSLAVDSEKNIWASTYGKGLIMWKSSGEKQNFTSENSSLVHNQIFRIFIDSHGVKWIGTAGGLASQTGEKKWKKEKFDGQITAITENKGSLWVLNVGAKGSELWQYENFSDWKKQPLPDDYQNDRVMDMSFDSQGRIWLVGSQIACWDKGNCTMYGQAEGFGSQSGLCIAADKEDRIWIGSEGRGLFRTYIEAKKTPTTPIVNSIDDLLGKPLTDEMLAKAFQLRINFQRGSAELLFTSQEELDKVARLLTENPDLQAEIMGHTDNVGNPQANVELSEQRAVAVKQYLCSKKGLAAERIRGKGYGGSLPIADNDHENTRKLNRRVEIKLNRKKP
jgi:outer membrane protein OmpA-like peptidoglycan-associated protein